MSDESTATPATGAKARKPRGPNKPVQGKFEIEFLKETAAPARAPLSNKGGPRETVMTDILEKLKANPGVLAVVFTSPDAQEVFKRRVTLTKAAERLGIELDEKNTASRAFVKDGAPVLGGDGKQLHALYAMVATEEVATAQAAARAAKAAAEALAAAK